MPFSTSSMANILEDLIQLKKQLATANPADDECLPYKEMLGLKKLLKEFGERYDLENLEKEKDLEFIISTIIFHLAKNSCFTLDNEPPISLSYDSQNGNHN